MAWPLVVAAVIVAAAAATKAGAAIQQGQQEQMLAEARGDTARFEGQMADLNMQGQAWRWKTEGLRLRATQNVSGANAGISLESQSFQNLQRESMASFEADAQRMIRQGEIYRRFGVSAQNMNYAGGAIQMAAGYQNAFASHLEGAGKIFSMFGGAGGAGGGAAPSSATGSTFRAGAQHPQYTQYGY